MPLIHIKCGPLSRDQKKRIGGRIIDAFHDEGVPASSVIVLFGKEDTDLLLEGGLLFEAPEAEPVAPPSGPRFVPPEPPEDPEDDARGRARRSKGELQSLKQKLISTLQAKGALSSFEAQDQLDLKNCDWAPATLRRFFSELEDEGVVLKQGQKRGTRYVWKGFNSLHASGQARLVKRSEEDPSSVGG